MPNSTECLFEDSKSVVALGSRLFGDCDAGGDCEANGDVAPRRGTGLVVLSWS